MSWLFGLCVSSSPHIKTWMLRKWTSLCSTPASLRVRVIFMFPGWKTAWVKANLPGLLCSAFLIYPYTPRWCLRVVEQRLRGTLLQADYLLHLLSSVKTWNKAMPRSVFWRQAPECSGGLLQSYTHAVKSIFFYFFLYKLPFTFLPRTVTSECRVGRKEEKRAGMVYLLLCSAPRCAVRAEGERRRSNLNRPFLFLWRCRGEVSLSMPFTGCLWERIHFSSFGICLRAWSYKKRSPLLYFFSSPYVLPTGQCQTLPGTE